MEAAFVLERIYWLGQKRIDESSVKAASLYYIKKRVAVLQMLNDKMDLFDSIPKMKPALSEVVSKHRFKSKVLAVL